METNKILGLVVGQHYSDRAFDTVMNSRSGETICAVLNPCGGGGMECGPAHGDGDKRWREEGEREGGGWKA